MKVKDNEKLKRFMNLWNSLKQKEFMQYTIKELAYEVTYDLLCKYYNNEDINDITIYYRPLHYNHKIIFKIDENLYFQFDIIIGIIQYGRRPYCLKVDNGVFIDKIPKIYKNIETV